MTDQPHSSIFSSNFPILIDNTMRKEFRKCERKFFHRHVLGLSRYGAENEHTIAGAAYARGLEVFRKKYYGSTQLPFEEALVDAFIALTEDIGEMEPTVSYKTWDRMACALISYFEEYPPSEDHLQPYIDDSGEPVVEFTFSIELPIYHPETGDPLLYGGKFDMIAQYGGEDGPIGVYDDKTTGQFGKSWAQGWELESQFSGYMMGAREWGYNVRSTFIRGAAIQKTQLPFLEVETQRPQYQLDRWWEQLLRDVSRMKECWEKGVWDWDLGDACSMFGGCPFLEICTSPNPEPWMTNNYVVDRWIPVEMEP